MRDPQDSDFEYLGLTPEQIDLLSGESVETREAIYSEAVRILMERDSGSEEIFDNLF